MKINIDKVEFDKQFNLFITYVLGTSGEKEFKSFSSNTFTQEQEGYKYEIYDLAREALSYKSWTREDIGTGKIHTATINALRLSGNLNNLVDWRLVDKYANKSILKFDLDTLEDLLYDLYHNNRDEGEIFTDLIDSIGANYSLIAYFFFIKDKQRFLPVSTKRFDMSFERIGVEEFKTMQSCTWENYQTYLMLLEETSLLLREKGIPDVSLLDAHSFLWIVSRDLEKEIKELPVIDWSIPQISRTKRETIVRMGQDVFRKKVLLYWKGKSCISGIDLPELLVAAHIKPFSACENQESSDIFNALLLTDTEHSLFDLGLIGFEDDGSLLVSGKLTDHQIKLLGLQKGFRLEGLDSNHVKYLSYHRNNIFNK